MMRTTLLEQWNYYHNLIRAKENAFIESQIGKNFPEILYELSFNGKLKELNIKNITYSHQLEKENVWLFFDKKKPSRKDIERLKNYYEADVEFVKEKILVEYSYELTNNFICSGAYYFFNNNKDLFASKPEAEALSRKLTAEFEYRKKFIEEHQKDASYNYSANGYKFLGWQNGWNHVYFDRDGNVTEDPARKYSFGYLTEDYPEYGKCRDRKHVWIEVSHNIRGSEHTVSCPICKIYWKYDSSD